MAYKPADRFNKAGNQYLREDKWLTKNVIEDESPSNRQWILMKRTLFLEQNVFWIALKHDLLLRNDR